MTNLAIYNLMDRFGMIDTTKQKNLTDFALRTGEEKFVEETCNDVVELMLFVDDILLENDTETIKNFLVAMFMYNNQLEVMQDQKIK